MTRIIQTLLPSKRAETAKKDAQELNIASMALRVRVEQFLRKSGQTQAA